MASFRKTLHAEKLPTGYRPFGSERRKSRIVDEYWVEAWVSKIASWPGVNLDTRLAAVLRVAKDTALQEVVLKMNCEENVSFDDFYLLLLAIWGADFDGKVEVGTASANGALWFDATGRIVRVEGVELRHVIAARDVTEMFARCNSMIRQLAGEGRAK